MREKFLIQFIIWSTCLLICGMAMAQQRLTENPTVLLSDPQNTIPIGSLSERNIIVVTPSVAKYRPFLEQSDRYLPIKSVDFSNYAEDTKNYNTIIIAGTNRDLRTDHLALARRSIVDGKQVIVCRFEDGAIRWSNSSLRGAAMLTIPSFDDRYQRLAAMSVFGGREITQGRHKREKIRLSYRKQDHSRININRLEQKIDAIAMEAISERATPGMVIMAVLHGEVIFEKAYGHHTYERLRPTQVSDIFDLASISKIAATTPVTMHLYDRNLIELDSTMGYYLPDARETNKANTTLRTVLLHEGGFTPYIPFYRELKPGDIASTKSESHQVKLADNAFLRTGYYEQIMWPTMLWSSIRNEGKYVYSDISMYAMKEVAEQVTGIHMQKYVEDFLYRPIGMKTAGFNPRDRFPKARIVPTENDTSFRKTLLEGYVHDQGAAMAGGVAGHAGLFSDANDLAIYGQMLLNRGKYGGVQFLKPETVDLFTSKQSLTSRRGLGFDRHDPDGSKSYPSSLANESVYGHTGYTGTCIWIDPKNQLVYIFLSNRVHPQVSPKLGALNIRSRIQDAIYQAINEAK